MIKMYKDLYNKCRCYQAAYVIISTAGLSQIKVHLVQVQFHHRLGAEA